MAILWRRALAWACVWALALFALTQAVTARAYTIDDLLRNEELRNIVVAPGGRWLIF